LTAYRTSSTRLETPSFFEDAEEIFFDRVLAEVEVAGDLAVAQAFGYEGDDLLFARVRMELPRELRTRTAGTSEITSIK